MLAVAVALVGVVGLLATHGLAQWVAAAGLLAAMPPLVQRAGAHRAWVQRRPRLPFALVVIAAAALLSELVRGRPPASRDHAIHMFEVHLLVDEFIPSGRLSGWTDSFNNGLPFGEAYPWFGHLWTAVPHLLTGGLVSQRTSYAWGLLAIWALAAVGVWLVAAEVAREINGERDDTPSLAAWAGCLGALVWLLDPGGSRQGGWTYLMFHGVWPQLLSATLWVLGLPLVWRALKQPSPRRLGLAALVLGGSVLAHPFGLLTLVCSAAIWLAVLTFARQSRPLPKGQFVWWALMHAAAAAIGFGWLASFLAGADSLGRSPVPWEPLGTLSTDLIRGTLFSGHGAWAGPLAVLGLVLALRRGGVIAWMTIGLGLGMLVLGSEEAITVLRLDLLASAFKNLQFPRYAIAIKPLLFALAGVGGAVGSRALRSWLGPRMPHTLGQRFIAALVFAPLVTAVVSDPGRLVTRPMGGVESLEGSGQAGFEAELRDALEREQAGLAGSRLRVAYFRKGMGGGMYPIMSVAAVGGALVLDGHVATINFEHRIARKSPEGLLGLGVTHVISDRALTTDADLAIAEHLVEVGVYGPYTLHRLAAQDVEPPAAVEWSEPATVAVTEQTAGAWTLDAASVDSPTAVVLPFAPHPKWVATLGGEPLEISVVRRWKKTTAATHVTVPHNGELKLVYQDTESERRARWIALVVGLAALAGLAWGRPLSVAARAPEAGRAPPQGQPLRAIVFTLAAVAAVVVVHQRQATQLAFTWETLAAERRDTKDKTLAFESDLVVEGDLAVTRTPTKVCVGILGKDNLDGCTEADHDPRESFLYRNPFLFRCLRFTVPPSGSAVVTAPSLNDGTWLMGTVLRVDRKGKGDKLSMRTKRRWQRMGNRARDVLVGGKGSTDPPTIEIRNQSTRNEAVCVSLAVLGP